jgi:purine-binding chemotaxis protein CheW
MDLVKARERAKQKAREEAEKKAAEQAAAVGKETALPEPPRAPAAKKKKKRKRPVAHRAPAKARQKKKGSAKAAGKVKKPRAAPPAPVPETEVFTDEAFGEDLPQMDLEEVLGEEVVLGEKPAKPAAGPEARKKETAAKEAGAAEEDFSWEPGAGAAARGPRQPRRRAPQAEKSPAPPGPEAPAKPVKRGKERKAAAAPPEQPRPLNGGEWRVEEPAAPARKTPAKNVELEFEGPEEAAPRAWTLDDLAGDDFFALVTEDLYAREFGRPEDEDQGATLELLSFKLASEIYGVPLTSIRQIIKMMPITMVPRAPAFVLGIISLRGSIIPIFDLRRRLNLQSAETTRRTRIVVVAEEACTVGLIVDAVEQVVRIPETSLEPPPPMLAGIEAGYIKGIGRYSQKMVLVLALDKILVPVMAAK